MPVIVYILILTMHFSGDKEWKGDMKATMEFSCPINVSENSKDEKKKLCDPQELCKNVRRAIWSRLKDAEGSLGDCTRVIVPGIDIPKLYDGNEILK